MRLVADANVLVAELVRSRGRDLLDNPALVLYVAELPWEETGHELGKRVAAMVEQGRVSEAAGRELLEGARGIAEARVSRVPALAYEHLRQEALARIPRDPEDWHTVALALALGADIWTTDGDFLGCGVATWTTETLATHLERHHQ